MNAKKIMAALAVTGCALTGLSSVESANIVGYQNLTPADLGAGEYAVYPMVGMTFYPVAPKAGEENLFTLGDVKVEGMKAVETEYFYQLLPASARMDTDSKIVYCDYENALELAEGDTEFAKELVGWWKGDVTGEAKDMINTRQYAIGTAFLGKLGGNHSIKLACSGAVNDAVKNVNISEKIYPMFNNPIPRTIKFGEVTVSNMKAVETEYFYQLLPASARMDTNSKIVYCDYENALELAEGDTEFAKELVGWWKGDVTGEAKDMINTLDFPSGVSYLGKLGANEDVFVNFPAAYTK